MWVLINYLRTFVCCLLQLNGKNSRIEELDGEVVSLQAQLDNVASTLDVSGLMIIFLYLCLQYMFGNLNCV